jgi:hypothetical protein
MRDTIVISIIVLISVLLGYILGIARDRDE